MEVDSAMVDYSPRIYSAAPFRFARTATYGASRRKSIHGRVFEGILGLSCRGNTCSRRLRAATNLHEYRPGMDDADLFTRLCNSARAPRSSHGCRVHD